MRILLALVALCGLSFALDQDWSTVTGSTHALFQTTSNYVVRAAEKMPEEHYNFKPADSVRTFAQMVGHIADAQYFFCGSLVKDGRKSPGIEKNAKTKAEIIAGLKEAFAYCDSAYRATTDSNAAEQVSLMGASRARLGVLNFNSVHIYEHYGNLTTYMRMKNIVPPSSEGR
jgi:uncharacterized damage-inducible protein DinB